jgi:hypothetical protein
MNHIGLATFRVDCLASRETERFQYDLISLYRPTQELSP